MSKERVKPRLESVFSYVRQYRLNVMLNYRLEELKKFGMTERVRYAFKGRPP